MPGCIVYNGFWNPDGPPEAVRRLCGAAAARGEDLIPMPNTAMTAVFGSHLEVAGWPGHPYALFWDKDIRLARALEATGVRLYNPAAGVAVCDDKAATHLALVGERIPMPRTLVAPMTYQHMGPPAAAFLRLAGEQLGFPLVVKECFGSLGGQVYLARTPAELGGMMPQLAARPFLLQEFVAASAGTDLRLYVVGDRVAAAMRRRSATDFRANIGAGGQAEPYSPTQEEVRLALACSRRLGVPLAGVDILHDGDGRPLVCEVNSSAQMMAISACTGVDVAGEIMEYVLCAEKRAEGDAG